MNITFLPVKDTPAKLLKLSHIAQKHLEQKEPLLFLVPDQNSLDFLDKLLWSTPETSFLPHPTELLTLSTEILPSYHSIFNLRSTPLLEKGFKTIYELEDHTSPEKYQLSQKRYHAYRDNQFAIVVES